MSDNILYTRAILSKGEGYPLFLPPPSDDLPESARRTGTEIGDVGVVTQDGSFDPIFNILCPANDRANRFGVPPGFIQVVLPPDDIRMQVPCYPPGYVISNTSVKRRHLEVEASLENNVHVYSCMPLFGVLIWTAGCYRSALGQHLRYPQM
jgi:hypothetical protein